MIVTTFAVGGISNVSIPVTCRTNKAGQEQQDVEEPDEAEEEGHVDAALIDHPLFHIYGVEAVGEGAEQRECIADGYFGACFKGEGSSTFVVLVWLGHVDGGDDGYPGKRGKDA